MTNREVLEIRKDFPLLQRGKTIYLDNAATMQRPRAVIDAVRKWEEQACANPLRGVYDLSVQATAKLEEVRAQVARYVGAESEEVIFTSGATGALNMVALMLGPALGESDEVVVCTDGHHSNILPWVDMNRRVGVQTRVVEPMRGGVVRARDIKKQLSPQTAVVALNMMSNVTGKVSEVKETAELVLRRGHALTVADAAQAVVHVPVDFEYLAAAFLAFSGHKLGAPMGVGVLCMRRELMQSLPPAFFGGEMADVVEIMENGKIGLEFSEGLQRYEAGTLNMEGIVGLGAALSYWEEHGREKLFDYVDNLTEYAVQELKAVPGLDLISGEHGVLSFNLRDIHPHDVAQILAAEGICVRAGYHCAQMLLDRIGAGPCVRASLAFYNTEEEIDRLATALKLVREKMGQ